MKQDEIIKVLQNLRNLDPLDPGAPKAKDRDNYQSWYVEDLHGKKTDDVIARLKLEIQASIGTRHAYLFTGTIGSGKSTELRRLAYELNKSQSYAAVVNISDYLNSQAPLALPDLLLAIALGATEAVARELGEDPESGQRGAWWVSLLKARPEVKEMEISLGPMKLKSALSADPTFRERLRKHFEGRLDKLVHDVNEFLFQQGQDVRQHRGLPENAHCVLLVDSLEQFGGLATVGGDDAVLQSLIQVFNQHGQQLRLNGWSVVYSVPPLLNKLAPGISTVFSQTAYLTSAHVYQDRSDNEDQATVKEKLIPLLTKRLGSHANQLLGPDVLHTIVIYSGGDLRTLMRIAADAVLEGQLAEQFPVTKVMLDKVLDRLRRPYLPLPNDAIERLRYVRKNKEPWLKTQAGWADVMNDLAAKRVLLYLNGTEWYDVHPLLRHAVDNEVDNKPA